MTGAITRHARQKVRGSETTACDRGETLNSIKSSTSFIRGYFSFYVLMWYSSQSFLLPFV